MPTGSLDRVFTSGILLMRVGWEENYQITEEESETGKLPQ